MQPPTLHTARLRLDAVRPDDTPLVAQYCADVELQRYIPVPVPYTREHADDYCVNYARAAAEGEGALWAIRWGDVESGITVADTGASPIVEGLLGVIELKPEPLGSAELGFWLGAPHRSRGVMSEAARAVCDWALRPDGLELSRIFWRAIAGNIGSASVARSCGFRFEGLWRAALPHRDQRVDAWCATLLATDSRDPKPGWPAPLEALR